MIRIPRDVVLPSDTPPWIRNVVRMLRTKQFYQIIQITAIHSTPLEELYNVLRTHARLRDTENGVLRMYTDWPAADELVSLDKIAIDNNVPLILLVVAPAPQPLIWPDYTETVVDIVPHARSGRARAGCAYEAHRYRSRGIHRRAESLASVAVAVDRQADHNHRLARDGACASSHEAAT